VGDEPVRPASLPNLLQDLYREGLGIPCSELRAEWAAQRIRDLSLTTALLHMLVRPRTTIRTLIEEFEYPGSSGNDVAGGCR